MAFKTGTLLSVTPLGVANFYSMNENFDGPHPGMASWRGADTWQDLEFDWEECGLGWDAAERIAVGRGGAIVY